VGYGMSHGYDVEDSGPCSRREFGPAFEAGAMQVMAVIRYAKTLPFVDPTRGVLVGQSVGGAITLAVAARNIENIVGAINFAGGSGGDPDLRPEEPCSEAMLRRVLASYGAKAKIPTLWLYSENDKYWGKDLPHAWYKAFRTQGGRAEFVQLPAHGDDGHSSFSRNPEAWKPAVEKFLLSVGFPR
jgi:dienelactone hydrolase